MKKNIGKSFITFFSAGMMVLLLASAGNAQTLNWKGYTWNETSGGMAGVANGNPANISVDANGYLHLSIVNNGGTWTASEVFTQKNLGFGTYQWQIQGAIDNMDKSTVLGLYPYGPAAGEGVDGENEIDVEYSLWDNTCGCNADFTVYPSTGNASAGQNYIDYTFSLSGGTLTTARMIWTSTGVQFYTLAGLQAIGTTPQNVLKTWNFQPPNPSVAVPQVASPLGINLWS